MIIVSDTSPLNNLILIDYQDVLPTLFGQIIIPPAVLSELQHAKTPEKIKKWIITKPDWLEVRTVRISPSNKLENLDYGEREAIFLAEELGADVIKDDVRMSWLSRQKEMALMMKIDATPTESLPRQPQLF
jgi:predicted nucleic acid-binding protein